VVVTRTANRDNTSNYTYNGKKMPFKVLAQELRRLGIDLDHNRFLILQVCLPFGRAAQPQTLDARPPTPMVALVLNVRNEDYVEAREGRREKDERYSWFSSRECSLCTG